MANKRDRNEELDSSIECKRAKRENEVSDSDEIDDEIVMDAKDETDILDATFVVKGLINDDEEESPYYLGITAMLNNITSLMDGSVVSSDLAKLIIDQGNIGGVIAQEGDGADDDIFGFYSILSLYQYPDPMKRFKNYINKMVKKRGNSLFNTEWNTLSRDDLIVPHDGKPLDNNLGLWLCHKAQNTPIPVILDIYNCVLGDIDWSLNVKDKEVGMTEEERVFYRYTHIMTLIPIHLMSQLEKGEYESQSQDNIVFNSIDHELIYKKSIARMLIPKGSLTEVTVKEDNKDRMVKAHDYLAILIMKMDKFSEMVLELGSHAGSVK